MPGTEKVTALVTGASAGIGAEFCRQLAARCDVIIATGRREAPLQALAAELSSQTEMHLISADLGAREGRAKVIEALRQKGPADYLINNAGFSTLGHFDQVDIDAQQGMIDVHITATMALCRAAIPFMRERLEAGAQRGGIINVSSLASFGPVPGAAVYAASKAFLNVFSESLHKELSDVGIPVQSLCPGYTLSEFHDRDAMDAFDRSWVPDEKWMQAAEVVSQSLAVLATGPVVFVPGAHNLDSARKGVQRALNKL
ncbi:MAG: SDR family NAD(P)-dependent oxidoreductase [Pseudomonadota bacterium]